MPKEHVAVARVCATGIGVRARAPKPDLLSFLSGLRARGGILHPKDGQPHNKHLYAYDEQCNGIRLFIVCEGLSDIKVFADFLADSEVSAERNMPLDPSPHLLMPPLRSG